VLQLSYVLPLRAACVPTDEFIAYVNSLSRLAEVILVDGSDESVFAAIDARFGAGIRHLAPDADLEGVANGKVRGVLAGLRVASHEAIVIADDDVRHTPESLSAMLSALAGADIVRPQNFFSPLPWHARVDTARTLINRMTGGDWPGTLGVRRSTLRQTGGYDGNVLFENLELVRTVVAGGGRFASLDSLFVRRLPPKTLHFWNQRVRQAYDEFARPFRLIVALSVMPAVLALVLSQRAVTALALLTVGPIVIAELGRRRSAGRQVFPLSASLCAPLWVVERATCAWLAVASRVIVGGIRYNGRILATAAHSPRALACVHGRSGRRKRSALDPTPTNTSLLLRRHRP
jgi:glycosyl transferase family 21